MPQWLKKWIKKCNDDSETSNWISANTKVCWFVDYWCSASSRTGGESCNKPSTPTSFIGMPKVSCDNREEWRL